jgi:transcriptional regulator with XRE-family HTH domain
MAKKKKTEEAPGLVEQLREAIRKSGRSLYQLGKDSGVGSDQLSRFMRGERTLTLPAAEKLCRALDLELASRAPHAPAETRGPGKRRRRRTRPAREEE